MPVPMVVADEGEMIAGHGRILAAAELTQQEDDRNPTQPAAA